MALKWLNIDFVGVLNICLEIFRVFDALDFRPPPPEFTFRGLEPLYRSSIEHYQERCELKYREIISEKNAEDGEDRDLTEQRFDELEGLLEKHSRLIQNLEISIRYPYLKTRKHSEQALQLDTPENELDRTLGAERYIEATHQGYGFSNDYIRQWLAAIPGPLGQHFETEDASSAHLTRIFHQIIIAIAAGASLLVPMIVMTFKKSQTTRLIVVSVATVLFGVAFAIVSRSKENILAGAAAYAAVMVVYIGSASPGAEQG